jgi:hypothetical protein
MVDAKQLKTQDLSWFRPGAIRPAVVCLGHYIAQHRVPVVGRLQARRERRRGLQVPGRMIGMSSDVVGELCVVRFGSLISHVVSPAAGEFTFLL